jgi:hypothetical protein
MASWTVKSGPSRSWSARAWASVPSTSGERPPMSAYFSDDEGARSLLMSFAKSGRNGPKGAVTTSGSAKSS